MIICRKCSRRHSDGAGFCDCGAYLEFDGEHVADASADRSTAPPAARPTAEPTRESASWGPVASPAHARPEPAPWSGFASDDTQVAPTSNGVQAQLPDAPVPAATAGPVWIEPTARAGDVPCPSCRTPNAPERLFCRHCGTAMEASATGPVATTSAGNVPWWRRLGRDARRRARRVDPNSLALGARRLSSGGVGGRVVAFRSGMGMIVALSLLSFLGPWRSTVISGARQLIGAERFETIPGSTILVAPIETPGIATITEFPLQNPELVLDEFSNTSWATRWVGSAEPGTVDPPDDGGCMPAAGTDSSLLFTFAGEDGVDLSRVRILGGRHAGDEERETFLRPRLLELKIGDDCGHIELDDDGVLAARDFSRRNVRQLEVRIIDIYGDPSMSQTVEISAILFDHRRL